LKFAGEACKRKDCDVCCFLGIRLEKLRHKMEKIDFKTKYPYVIVIHAGTNSIRHGTSAIEIMGDTMDLIDYIRREVPKTKFIISRVLYWRNIIVTSQVESTQSWTGYVLYVIASWLMATAGLGNSM
jgi:hypothetical protein